MVGDVKDGGGYRNAHSGFIRSIEVRGLFFDPIDGVTPDEKFQISNGDYPQSCLPIGDIFGIV